MEDRNRTPAQIKTRIVLSFDVKGRRGIGKGILSLVIFCLGAACNSSQLRPLTILLDAAPVTLNPRASYDAAGQRLGALLFRALTHLDADLKPEPDLAAEWKIWNSGKLWEFPLRKAVDHEGIPITAAAMAECLESYRVGVPVYPLRQAFSSWIGTYSKGDSVFLKLNRPDPYLPENLTLLRYFRTRGDEKPCLEPKSATAMIGSGRFRPTTWDFTPENEIDLEPVSPNDKPVRFVFVQDDNTRAFRLLKGEVDGILNSLSLAKTRWIQHAYSGRFKLLERPGVTVSYLTFNLRDPILSNLKVRQAIAQAIDRESIVENKLFGFGKVAGSILPPMLPESHTGEFPYDPGGSEKLLDEAGYPRKNDGIRFALTYKTTTAREGREAALMIQEMLRKIGIRLDLEVVEPAVFIASIREKKFQIYSSRWVGICDGSILYRTLRSGNWDNRAGYENPVVDRLLDQALSEMKEPKRIALVQEVQKITDRELPYLPLWFWTNGLILRKGLGGIESQDLSISGALEPLARIR